MYFRCRFQIDEHLEVDDDYWRGNGAASQLKRIGGTGEHDDTPEREDFFAYAAASSRD